MFDTAPRSIDREDIDLKSKDFERLSSLYFNVTETRIDDRYKLTARAVVFRENGIVVGGFFYGPEDERKMEVQKYSKYLPTDYDQYVTGLIKDKKAAPNLDMTSELVSFTRKNPDKKFWGIVDKQNEGLLNKYKKLGVQVVHVPNDIYNIVIF